MSYTAYCVVFLKLTAGAADGGAESRDARPRGDTTEQNVGRPTTAR